MWLRNDEKTSFIKAKKLTKRTERKNQQQTHKTCNAIIGGNSVYQHLLKKWSAVMDFHFTKRNIRTVDRNGKSYI